VALEALKGHKTINELVSHFGVHPNGTDVASNDFYSTPYNRQEELNSLGLTSEHKKPPMRKDNAKRSRYPSPFSYR
jgi:hypothetical protein